MTEGHANRKDDYKYSRLSGSSMSGDTIQSMPCEERDKLMELVLVAMKARHDARQALIGRDGEALRRAHKLADEANLNYQDCREALEAHVRAHGCGGDALNKLPTHD